MKRRMIATDIISEGKFLRMSMTAQAFYMHLLANADDDGCVDAFTIMRMVGAKEDDLVLLKEREYITILDQKEFILWITDWQEFNHIPAHIKEDSKHLPLLRAKVAGIRIVESTKEADNHRRYSQLKLQRQSKKLDPDRIILGSSSDHGHDPNSRLGKDRIDKNNNTTHNEPKALEVERRSNETFTYWEEVIGSITTTVDTQRKACVTLQNKYGLESCQKAIRVVALAHADRYARKEVKCMTPTCVQKNWDKIWIYAKSKVGQVSAEQAVHI